jgi:hypothetical protein
MVNVVVKPGQDQLVVIIQHARTPVHIIHNAYQLHQVLLALHLPVVRQAVLKAVRHRQAVLSVHQQHHLEMMVVNQVPQPDIGIVVKQVVDGMVKLL